MKEFNKVNQGRVPAKQTLEFINRVEVKFDNIENNMNEVITNIQLMKKDIKIICEKLDENKEEHRVIMEKIDSFVSTSDQKYAKKEVEIWINWALKIIVGSVLLALLGLIVIKTA